MIVYVKHLREDALPEKKKGGGSQTKKSNNPIRPYKTNKLRKTIETKVILQKNCTSAYYQLKKPLSLMA